MVFHMNLNGHVVATKASHLVGGHRLWRKLERDGTRQLKKSTTRHMTSTITNHSQRPVFGTRHGEMMTENLATAQMLAPRPLLLLLRAKTEIDKTKIHNVDMVDNIISMLVN